ncbi:hypothetical protein TRIATDRAFT_303872 [Trichoderma atroviride IMI 206040]|uniref:SNF2 N-terminal domain-containing protein n=1 Tax=Hypocrea atroviridis (strain ATCC 20476 / IMI 206040) TaxID=452589 RepID=G9NG89_HYPAI|nr:uncharacterized protein TRIATDRAFT_303872 [Trichoderma atroviride IMI 206040]EHK50301.1 hypothetical protein TRIATDRAFT_303872 [Trichoderma atroviride IMI 206040]
MAQHEDGIFNNTLRLLNWDHLIWVTGTPVMSSSRDIMSPLGLMWRKVDIDLEGISEKVGRPDGKDKFNPLIIDSDSDVEDDLTTARVEEQEARTTLEDSGRALDGAEMASSPLTEANEWLFASGNGDVTDLNSQIKSIIDHITHKLPFLISLPNTQSIVGTNHNHDGKHCFNMSTTVLAHIAQLPLLSPTKRHKDIKYS